MPKIDLRDFKKLNETEDKLTNMSISVKTSQKNWVEKQDINFSALVREFIEGLKKESETK